MDITKFNEKLNRLSGNVYTIEEEVIPVNGVYEAPLMHDNVTTSTINVYTGSKLTGDKINTYSSSTPSLTPWKTIIKIFSNAPKLYISYEATGDQVEAEDINNLQDAVNETQKALNDETDRATNAENVLTDNLNSEISRAKSSENTITNNLNSEITRAKSAENTLTNNLANEVNRATAAESTLNNTINSEVNRATNVEGTLTNNLNSEITRAKAAENSLVNTINANKPNWDDKYTKNETDNKFNQLVTALDWKESVSTYSAIATTYPTPDDGWTVNVKDTDITYRYDGSAWIPISANSIPLATKDVDGKMSKQDKIDHDDMVSKRHIHSNKGILDVITQALLDAWNSAYTHISDAIRHITQDERNKWNNAVSTVASGTVNNSDKLDGLHSTDFARAYSSSTNFGLSQTTMTTAEFISLISSMGAFNQPYWVSRGSWAYANNKYISDTGIGNIHLAGATVEVIGNSSVYTIRIHTPTTSMSGVVNTEFIYVNNGSDYSPGWRKIWNDKNDGSGSGLDADLLDGKHASDFAPSGYGLGTDGTNISGSDLNTIQTTGFYIGNGCSNAPNNGWFYYIVISHPDKGWTCQYAISYGSGNTGNILYTRTKINGTWSSWSNYYSNNNKPSPSDIGAYTKTESDNKFATKDQISQAGYGDMLKSIYDTNNDGVVDKAEKLSNARKINGINFDGSGDITIYDNTKLPLSGGTITGRTLFNQGISIININGGAGTAGFMYFAQIKVNSSYQNQPILFDIHQRERFGTIIIKFNSQNTSDPTLAYINKIGNINAYIYKSATSTWDLYIQKSEGYDSIDIVGFSKGDYMNSTSVTWQSSTVTSLPTGYTEASIATIDIISTKAAQDSDGKQINSTYVKKGMTWNDLEGV